MFNIVKYNINFLFFSNIKVLLRLFILDLFLIKIVKIKDNEYKTKYTNNIFILIKIAASNHPKCAMEEKAKIFLILVWFKPPKEPKIKDIIKLKFIINWLLKFKVKIIKGANFCHVKIKIIFVQFIASTNVGTQKWKGAAPILVNKAKLIKFCAVNIRLFWIVIKISKDDLIDWIMKYLIAASTEKIFFLSMIKGTNPRIFISIPSQMGNQEFDLILINLPKTIIKIKGVEEGLKYNIKKGG